MDIELKNKEVNNLKSNLQRMQLESQGNYRKVNDLENQIHLLEDKLSEI